MADLINLSVLQCDFFFFGFLCSLYGTLYSIKSLCFHFLVLGKQCSGPARAIHRTLCGPWISSDYNIMSLMEPLIPEILWTALNQFLEAAKAHQKKSPRSGAQALCRPYLLVCQRLMSNLRALIEGNWSQTWIDIEGQRSMDSSRASILLRKSSSG